MGSLSSSFHSSLPLTLSCCCLHSSTLNPLHTHTKSTQSHPRPLLIPTTTLSGSSLLLSCFIAKPWLCLSISFLPCTYNLHLHLATHQRCPLPHQTPSSRSHAPSSCLSPSLAPPPFREAPYHTQPAPSLKSPPSRHASILTPS